MLRKRFSYVSAVLFILVLVRSIDSISHQEILTGAVAQRLNFSYTQRRVVEPRVVVHYHIGSTGGSHIRALFQRDARWKTIIHCGSTDSGRFASEEHKLLVANETEKVYVEFHCGLKLDEVVSAVKELRSQLSPARQHELLSFTVLRHPYDQLCSSRRHRHQDWYAYTHGKVRDNMVSIAEHGKRSCDRSGNIQVDETAANRALNNFIEFDAIIDLYAVDVWLKDTFRHGLDADAKVHDKTNKSLPGKTFENCFLPYANLPSVDLWIYRALLGDPIKPFYGPVALVKRRVNVSQSSPVNVSHAAYEWSYPETSCVNDMVKAALEDESATKHNKYSAFCVFYNDCMAWYLAGQHLELDGVADVHTASKLLVVAYPGDEVTFASDRLSSENNSDIYIVYVTRNFLHDDRAQKSVRRLRLSGGVMLPQASSSINEFRYDHRVLLDLKRIIEMKRWISISTYSNTSKHRPYRALNEIVVYLISDMVRKGSVPNVDFFSGKDPNRSTESGITHITDVICSS